MLIEALITFIFRALPEAFIHIFAMYAFTGAKIDKKKYIQSSVLIAIIMVIIRALPISYGIHTILIIMGIIAISIGINQINIIHCISIILLNVVLQFLSEGINVVIIEKVFKMSIADAVADSMNMVIYSIPSLVIWGGVIVIAYKVIRRKKSCQNA